MGKALSGVVSCTRADLVTYFDLKNISFRILSFLFDHFVTFDCCNRLMLPHPRLSQFICNALKTDMFCQFEFLDDSENYYDKGMKSKVMPTGPVLITYDHGYYPSDRLQLHVYNVMLLYVYLQYTTSMLFEV